MENVPQEAEALPPAADVPAPGGAEPPLALELLVHGVGGVTPQEMLDDPRVVRVAGDATAGLYRRAADVDAEARPERAHGGPVQEAYSWSGLTSGNASRALWLLLLPFMIVNLAYWMRPAAPPSRTGAPGRPARFHDVVLRLLALSLTVLFVAGACEIAMDLVAWQCAGSAQCSGHTSWLGFVSAARHGWWSPPGRRIALAAVPPAALVGLMWLLSHRTWAAYECQMPPGTNPSGPAPGAPALAVRAFWYGRRCVARLQSAHTATAFLTIATALLLPALTRDADTGAALRWPGTVLATAVAVAAVTALVVICREGPRDDDMDDVPEHRVIRALPYLSVTLVALAAVYGGWARPGWTSRGRLPGSGMFADVTLLQGILLVALALTARHMLRAARKAGSHGTGGRIAVRGYGGPLVAVLACGLGGVFTGGTAQRAADWLDGGGTPGARHDVLPGPPVLLSWQAAAIPVILLVLLAVGVAAALKLRRDKRADAAEVRAGHPGQPEDGARTRLIAGAIARAGLTDASPVLVAALTCGAFVLGAAALAATWLLGRSPVAAAATAPGPVAGAADTAQALGSWLLGAAAMALIALGRSAYGSLAARRTVGILWDVGTYWPRAAHPFAPPCYAERAVPDLTWRIATWTRATGGRLVLSAHSQGTVLAASAVWQLAPETRRRIALLTYGSPLERLYGRWFPAYFGPPALEALHGELHAWRNLWRRTDPIGGPVRVGIPAGGGIPAESGAPAGVDKPQGVGIPQGAGEPAGVGTPLHASASATAGLPAAGGVPGAGDPFGAGVDVGPLRDPAAYGRDAAHPLPAPVLAHSDYQEDPAFAAERAALLARIPGQGQGSSGRSSG